MACKTIRVSSRALGPRLFVTVKVYDTADEMRRAGQRYNGTYCGDAIGLTQVEVDGTGRASAVTVRLVRGRLGTQIVVHEMHHASASLYGAHVGDRISSHAHLNHYNEPYAHLHSDLTQRLVDRLYELGYYGADTD